MTSDIRSAFLKLVQKRLEGMWVQAEIRPDLFIDDPSQFPYPYCLTMPDYDKLECVIKMNHGEQYISMKLRQDFPFTSPITLIRDPLPHPAIINVLGREEGTVLSEIFQPWMSFKQYMLVVCELIEASYLSLV